MRARLIPHPSTPSGTIRTVEAAIELTPDQLRVRYRVVADPAAIVWPEPRPAQRQDGLWQHTCFELFAKPASDSGYRELNFSPSTCWAVYAFDHYRTGMRAPEVKIAPSIRTELDVNCLTLEATIERSALPFHENERVLLGLSAVLEERERGKSYWALAHPAATPDFHHSDAFTLVLDQESQR
jgi:hypothetical protein